MAFNKRLFIGGAAECNTETVTAFGANAASSSNYAVYKLDGDSNDVTTNYNATNNVSFNSSGKFSQSATFNNTNTVIELPSTIDDPMRTAGAFTVSIWYKHATQTNAYGGRIVGLLNNIYNLISVHASNNTITGMVSNSSNSTSSVTSSALSTGTWYHLVWTGNATNGVSLYIDSVLIGSAAWDGTFYAYTDTNYKYNRLGYQNLSVASLVGEIDQARFFDRAITYTEVAELYAETSSTTSNTNLLNDGAGVTLFQFDYDASDTAGLRNGTPTDIDFGVGGQINTGAKFNGSSSKITFNAPYSHTSDTEDLSISLWFKIDTLFTTSFQTILGGDIANSSGNTGTVAILLRYKSAGKYLIDLTRVFNDDARYHTAFSSSDEISLAANTWTHMVITYEGSDSSKTNKLYVNGSLIYSISPNTYTTSGNGTNNSLAFGQYRDGQSTYNFDGTLDQARFFTKVLSASEVSTLYAETACVHTATTTDIDYPVTNAAYYKLDNSAEDSHGNTYDGTETNVEYRFGRFNQAAVFNGTNSVITLGTNIFKYTNLTVSAWINPNVSNTNVKTIYANTSYVNGQQFHGIIIGVQNNSSADRIIVQHYPSSTNTYSVESIPLDTYTHVAVTSTSSETKIYINGRLDSTHSASLSYSASQTAKAAIGAYLLHDYTGSTTYSQFSGKIDQVRIFESVLSAANVTSLIAEKPVIDTSNFKTVLYEGNNSTQYVSNVGFQPDFVWVKVRSAAGYYHNLFDTIRGATNRIFSNLPNAEDANGKLTSFDANGFFLSAGGDANPSQSMVAWCWKGAGTAVSNTNGTNITSSVSANVSAGFSIVKWTGDNNSSSSVGHGLTVNSENMLVFIKDVDGSSDWMVLTNNLWTTPQQRFLKLNTTAAVDTSGVNVYNVDNTTFKNAYRNINGNDHIAYCFHSVSGYQKIGTYEGTNSTVTVSDVGFKPTFVMIKNADDAANWVMLDNRRNTITDRLNNWLRADTDDAESGAVSTAYITVNDNGFIVANSTSLGTNSNGDTYIYMAIK